VSTKKGIYVTVGSNRLWKQILTSQFTDTQIQCDLKSETKTDKSLKINNITVKQSTAYFRTPHKKFYMVLYLSLFLCVPVF
jgi:hypothetical protein